MGKPPPFFRRKSFSSSVYTSGMLENELSGYAGVESVYDLENAHDYGFDPAGPFPVEDEDYQVVVPETSLQLSHEQMADLEKR